MHTKSCLVCSGFIFLGVVLMVLGLGFFVSRPTMPTSNLRTVSLPFVHPNADKLLDNYDGQEIAVTVVSSDSAMNQLASLKQENVKIVIRKVSGPVHNGDLAEERATLLTPTTAGERNNQISLVKRLPGVIRLPAVLRHLREEPEIPQPQEILPQMNHLLGDDGIVGNNLRNTENQLRYYTANDNPAATYNYPENEYITLDDDINEDDDQPYDDDDDDGDKTDNEPIKQLDEKEIAGEDLQNGDGHGILFFEVNL